MTLLFLQQWFSEQVLKAIGWTLVHSLWQGLLAAVLTGVIIIATRRSKASVRYNLFGAVLGLFVVATIITFLQLMKSEVATETRHLNGTSAYPITAVTIDISGTTVANEVKTIDKFASYFDRNADLFVLIWAIFFFIHCIKLGAGIAGVHRMRSYKAWQPPAEWSARINQLCKTLGVNQTVNLLESGLVKVPVAIGVLKPVILVPLGLLSQLPPEQVETVLLHELAHIRRKDYLVNILQRVAEAVFFFNPALLWISSLIRQEREACCDDLVMANTNHKGSYLEALVSFQEYSLPATGYAMAIGSKRNYLLNRVKRMITHENQKLKSMEKLFLAMGLIAVTAFTFIPKDQPANKANITAPVQSSILNEQKITTPAETNLDRNKTIIMHPHTRTTAKINLNPAPIDTVPAKKDKEKTTDQELRFPSISSTINDDGTTKTESITATDQDGKKYSYTKLNDKITSLTINGKNIPESDFDKYSDLIDQIQRSVQERQLMRLQNLAVKKMMLQNQTEGLKHQLFQKQIMSKELQESQQLQKKLLFNQQLHLKQNLKLNQQEKKELEKKSREVMKILQKLKKVEMVPMVDGREVSVNTMVAPVITQIPGTTTLCINPIVLQPTQLNQTVQVTAPVKTTMNTKLFTTVQPVQLKQTLHMTAPVKATLDLQLHNTVKPLFKTSDCKKVAPVQISPEVKPVTTSPNKQMIFPVKQREVS